MLGRRIAVIGATISGNKGAQAMLSAAVHHLSQRIPGSSFSVLSVYPKEDRELNKDPRLRIVGCKPLHLLFLIMPLCCVHRLLRKLHLPRRFVRRVPAIRALLDADLVVDVAGISFSDGRGVIVLYNAAMVLPALLLDKKVFKASQALGPFRTRINHWLARRCLPRVAAIVARGAITQQHLAEIGLPGRPICADVAFAVPVDEAAARAAEQLCRDAFFGSANLIGVSPSTVVESYCAKRGIDYPAVVARFVDHLVETYQANVVVLAHAVRSGKPKSRTNDLPTCRRVYQQITRTDRCRLLDAALSAEELRHVIGKMRFFVASRFHAMISGLTMGVPTLLVGWSHKYLEVLDMFDLGQWQMDYSDFSFDEVAARFRALMTSEDGIKHRIATHLPAVKASSESNWDIAAKLLDAPLLAPESKAPFGSREGAEFWLGKFDQCFVGYAASEDVREGAASGGAVSATLVWLLETGRIDGALVSRLIPNEGRLQPQTWVARSREEILSARTSIYLDFPLTQHFLRLLDSAGRYAVVALPCQLAALRKMEQKRPELRDKIACRLGLVCGHASDRKLLDRVLEKKGIRQEDIREFAFRKGHWRGRSYVSMNDGTEITFPYLDFGLYQNLWLHCARRCLSCQDHFAEHSDLSFGDAWLPELKSQPIKHSIIVSRSAEATAVLDEMMAQGALAAERADPFTLVRAQKRSLIYHKRNIAGRRRLAPLLGMRVSYDGHHRPRWNDLVGALFFLLAVRVSRNDRWADLVMRLPKPLLYPYLAAMKLMINF
jgi:coenzyme F420-reducing hydrogenase beta subunit/polysaccharide pyruvyl transferase WcaK-like protein